MQTISGEQVTELSFMQGDPYDMPTEVYGVLLPTSVCERILKKYPSKESEQVLDATIVEFFFRLAFGEGDSGERRAAEAELAAIKANVAGWRAADDAIRAADVE